MKQWRLGKLLIPLMLLCLSLLANGSHWLPSTHPAHAQSSPFTSVFVTPGSITDFPKSGQKTAVFGVNVTSSPSIGIFRVVLYYDTTMFSAQSVDYVGNVLGPNANVFLLCIDGAPQTGSRPCLDTDGVGVITVALDLLGAESPPISMGLLFHVTFKIIGTGLGQVHIFLAQLTTTEGVSVPLSTEDGYFTNLDCPRGSGVACKSPIVNIKVTPSTPAQGGIATFNVTVTERNARAAPIMYHWDWGDGTVPQIQTDVTQPMQHAFFLTSFGLGGCVGAGACRVTLTIHDNETVVWDTTIVVILVHLFIQLSVGEVDLDHQYYVIPGTLVHIKAQIVNTSTIAENATLTITLEGARPPLNSKNFSLKPSGATGSLSAIWDTSGYVPRAYDLVVSVSNPVSAQPVGGKIITGENDTSNNVRDSYVLLVAPQVTGALSLGLVQTTALGILVLVAVVVGLTRFLKKPNYESEPL